MNKPESITLREVEPADLETFYVQQLDPEAIRMAAFVGKDRKDKVVFDAHWEKILKSPQNINRTIVVGGQVAGYIACFPLGGNMEVTYWLGREFWGRGLATQALNLMLRLVTARPLGAAAAADNLGSLRVLQKCGFKIIGKDKGFAQGRGEDTEEYILRLDPEQTNRPRKLTPLVRYVTLRLYGRPILGYLWFIWLACVFFTISANGASPSDPEYGETRGIALAAGCGIFFGLCRIAVLFFSRSGRQWLFQIYSEEKKESIGIGSVVLVRSVPLIALVALVQFFR